MPKTICLPTFPYNVETRHCLVSTAPISFLLKLKQKLNAAFKLNPPPRSPRLRAKKSLIFSIELFKRRFWRAETRSTRRREVIQLSNQVETRHCLVSTALSSISWFNEPPQSHFAPTTHHQKNKYRNESA